MCLPSSVPHRLFFGRFSVVVPSVASVWRVVVSGGFVAVTTLFSVVSAKLFVEFLSIVSVVFVLVVIVDVFALVGHGGSHRLDLQEHFGQGTPISSVLIALLGV